MYKLQCVSAIVPIGGQCGGLGYNGDTICEITTACIYVNHTFSQVNLKKNKNSLVCILI
jgi:hypothetical protein